jgi:DMSO/TMAO reductase YedYZ molybdopterin-dependent catalytic subunit
MKKKLTLILISTVAVAALTFFSYFIFQNEARKRSGGETFIPEEINIDEIKNDKDFAQAIPEYQILFTGLLEEESDITFNDILDRYGDNVETFDATGVRSDGEVVELEFTGIKLDHILNDLKLKSEVENVVIYATDLFAADFEIEVLKDGDVYLVWKKDGQYLNPTADGVLKIVMNNGPTYKWVKNPVLFDFIAQLDDLVPLEDRLEIDAIDFVSEQNFFRLQIGIIPEIDIDQWDLEIGGLVENPLVLSYSDILDMPQSSVFATLETISNPRGGSFIGNAIWTGVPFDYILEQVVPDEDALEVVFYCEDGYSTSLTMEDVLKEGVMLAYKMNGKTLTAEHGYPVRMVVPEKYGMKWPKWINTIELVDYDYKGYWEQMGYSDYAGRDRPDERYD